MLIENPESLQTWLTSYLEPLCDADPQALAQYVIALICKDKPTTDLRHILFEQLEVFLQKETLPFVEVLFDIVERKSYLEPVELDHNCPSSIRSSNILDGLQSCVDNFGTRENQDSPLQSLSRSHSRSQSRSPPNSSSQTHHRDVDMRRPGDYNASDQTCEESRVYFDEDERNRSTGWNGSSSREINRRFRQSRSRSRSFSPQQNDDRSRSRSNNRIQSSSRSRSRDGGPVSKRTRVSSNSRVHEELQDEDKDEKPLLIRERCVDYEERGFCLRGDLCQFEHVSDPMVLDAALSSVVFGGTPDETPMVTQNISNVGPISFLNEPYNPEAPGIDKPIKPHGNRLMSVVGSLSDPLCDPMGENFVNIPQQSFWRPVHPLHPGSMSPSANENNGHLYNNNNPTNRSKRKGRGNRRRNRTRGGFFKRVMNDESADKCTLEVRKIPPNLNTIANLNSHFSKFGSIVNLQVGYDGDPRAALIKFIGHKDALAAHRSTKAIFNNRFIKIFWHQNNQKQQQQPSSSSNSFINQGPGHNFHHQNHHFVHNHSSSSDYINSQYYQSNEYPDSNEFNFVRSNVKERLGFRHGFEFDPNMTISANVNSCGSISRTVHNPANMRSHYTSATSAGDNTTSANNNKPITYMPSFVNNNTSIKSELDYEGFGVAPFNTLNTVEPPMVIKSKEDINRDKILTKLDLQKKRQHILVSCMQDQKLLIEKLEKAKSDKEKLEIRSTVETFAQKIIKLESEIKQDTEIILNEIAQLPSSIRKNKIQVEKELLDVEMDFYNELHNGATASELHKKLQELKAKAKALCMNDLQSTKNMIKRFAKMRIALRDRNRFANHTLAKNFENLRKVDRRTRKIFIEGVTANDNTLLLSHLSQSAEIESLETTPRGVMVTFKTRRDAEMALPLISTVKLQGETPLKASWFDEAVLCSSLLCYISFLCPN
ncbi:RNA-binding protein 26-like [Panonychus citri]|uniref:RNA-binding protein 26-like n=1 Tax=Panonychus citri TaxID=50023 RepID=UPI00230797E4|nr:RNA-binding protein 26-like [Panonychus citri]